MPASKLADEFAIQPEILLLRSADGMPVKQVFPRWAVVEKEAFNEAKSQHVYGKLRSDGKRDNLNCVVHVVNILKPVDVEFAKAVYHHIDPCGMLGKPSDGRAYKAYGINGALTCNYVLDFETLIKKINGILSCEDKEKAERMKLLLLLELKQLNFIGQLVAACSLNAIKFIDICN